MFSVLLVFVAFAIAGRLAHLLYHRIEHRADEAKTGSRAEARWLSLLLVAAILVIVIEYGGDAATESQRKSVENREQHKVAHERYLELERSLPRPTPTLDPYFLPPSTTPIAIPTPNPGYTAPDSTASPRYVIPPESSADSTTPPLSTPSPQTQLG